MIPSCVGTATAGPIDAVPTICSFQALADTFAGKGPGVSCSKVARKQPAGSVPNFGVGEWYGYLLTGLQPNKRSRLSSLHQAKTRMPCPFKPAVDGLAQPCNKAGGVCSFRAYVTSGDGSARPASGNAGKLRVACPSRFLGSDVEEAISARLLGTKEPEVIREVGFLTSELAAQQQPNEQIDLEVADDLEARDADPGSDVGRIDLILRNPDTNLWCAVEHQAVYFSGAKMGPDFLAIGKHTGPGLPVPGGRRRPDYRSSGPKRLMPQLQVKVPTLRRWGKKMAVVVDESFFAALGSMDTVSEPSNADIAWVIVALIDKGHKADLIFKEVVYTTLERAVEGLTAGRPVSLPEFEDRIREKLDGLDRKHKELLKKLQKENLHPGL